MSTEAIFPQDTVELVKSHVREVEDFPARGVLFRDITPLIADGKAFAALVEILAERYRGKCDAIAGLESRGFILGAPLAHALGIGMITVRKAGRLPGPVVGINYELEYGSARMELQPFTLEDGMRVLVIDDVLATGGTAGAAFDLITQAGGIPAGLCVLLELTELGGRDYLAQHCDVPIESVIAY
ncbi:adenine phosphoribosyltransferase [Trueperella sp. LYQ143]|uniref:adenine phosphoribosyltransferase n=1 Tax=unclassified Trueperella TaxID=2630174 RepID=UPI0039835DDD